MLRYRVRPINRKPKRRSASHLAAAGGVPTSRRHPRLPNTSPPLVALYIRLGCRSSNASLNIVWLGCRPMSTRFQDVPPLVLRKQDADITSEISPRRYPDRLGVARHFPYVLRCRGSRFAPWPLVEGFEASLHVLPVVAVVRDCWNMPARVML